MRVIITVDYYEIELVVMELKKLGFDIDKVMEDSGMISGTYRWDGDLNELRSLSGVIAVEEEEQVFDAVRRRR